MRRTLDFERKVNGQTLAALMAALALACGGTSRSGTGPSGPASANDAGDATADASGRDGGAAATETGAAACITGQPPQGTGQSADCWPTGAPGSCAICGMDSMATPYACGDGTGTPTTGLNPQAMTAQTQIGPCVQNGPREWCCSTESYMSDAAAPSTSACVRISSHDTICSGVANADGMQRAAFLCPFAPFSTQPIVTAVNCSPVNHGAVDAGGAYVASNYAVVCCGM